MKNQVLSRSQKFIWLTFLFFLSGSCEIVFSQNAGDIDTGFNSTDIGFGNGDGANSIVTAAGLQNDGKIIFGGGGITSYNGTAVKQLLRIQPNGQRDTSFNPGNGPNYDVRSIIIQPDGKILIAGTFTVFNGISRNRIARLNIDGSLDNTFNPGTGANSDINKAVLLGNGKILIGGWFTSYNGNTRNYLARLNSDGSLDTSFNASPGANSAIYAITPVAGNFMIGGWFTTYNGTAINRIARIDSLGNPDAGFNPGSGADDDVNEILIQDDGKYLVAGCFLNFNNVSRTGIVRINPDGTIDNSFNPGSGTGSGFPCVNTALLNNDGKIFLGGSFTQYNGTPTMTVIRLNTDGSLDSSFDAGSPEFDYTIGINSLILQNDEKIIVAGSFTNFNGIMRNRITRLNQDGAWDETFNPGTGANAKIFDAGIQTDGKILIGGSFTSVNGMPKGEIARLNEDGTLDSSFSQGKGAYGIGGSLLDPSVYTLAIQSDGKIIIGGGFIYYDGNSKNRIARLNPDGTMDNTFNMGSGLNGYLDKILIQPDGKILLSGDFSTYNGVTSGSFIRLNPDGTKDNSFNSGANGYIEAISILPDGKIMIGGYFTFYSGIPINRIARLNADGSLDNAFNPGTGANNTILACTLQPDGKIIIGGSFTSYNGTTRNRIARINSDGSLDTTFSPGSGAGSYVTAIALSSLGDGKIIIGGGFGSYNGTVINRIARLNANGSLDTGFNAGNGTGSNSLVTDVISAANGKIIITGDFTSYKGTGRNRIARIWGSCTFQHDVTVSNNSCAGSNDGTIQSMVSGGASPYNYEWSSGDSTENISGLSAGNYSLTVTDNQNCIAIKNAEITEPSPIVSNQNFAICEGDSIFLEGNYQTETANYYDTLQALNGCDSVIVSALVMNTSPVMNQQKSICSGDSIFLQGVYQTSAGNYYDTLSTVFACDSVIETTLSIIQHSSSTLNETTCDSFTLNSQTYTASGTYTQTLTNAAGCDSTIMLNLTINPSSIFNAQFSICDGDSIFLEGNYQTNSGTYYDTLNTINGCDSIVETLLTVNIPGVLSTSTLNITCHGLCDGTATASLPGGCTPQTYEWSNGGNTATITNLCAGKYFVTATQCNGCSVLDSVELSEPPILSLSDSISNATCYGVCNGNAVLIVDGGTSPYSYLWDSGCLQCPPLPNTWCAGTYSVTVVDANGCTDNDTFSILQPQSITLSLSSTPDSGNVDGTATATPTGGTPPYSFLWNTNDISSQISNLTSQYYYVTVTDANGCSTTDSVFVDFYVGNNSHISHLTSHISIIPNPNNGKFLVRSSEFGEGVEIRIYNVLGEMIFITELLTPNSQLDLSRQGSGMYDVQVISENRVLVKKVVVE